MFRLVSFKLILCFYILWAPLSYANENGKPFADWGIATFPALEEYNLITLYLNWSKAYDAAFAETAQLGVTRALITKNWHELEAENAKQDVADLLHKIGQARQHGQSIFFGLQLINTVKREVPDDLATTAWDDPAMLARVLVLLEKVLSQLDKSQLNYFSFGNEVDIYFAQHPAEIEPYQRLFRAVKTAVGKQYPQIRLGITVTDEGLRGERRAIIDRINQDTDVLILTYYPVKAMQVLPPASPQDDLPRMARYAAGKPVLLQEVGYPSAAGAGSSPVAQAEFIRQFFSAWARHRDAIPYISLFMQTDFSTHLCRQLTGYYGFEAMQQLFADNICTLGLKDAYGKPKPAWTVLTQEIVPGLRTAK